jgi:hypothetical protein
MCEGGESDMSLVEIIIKFFGGHTVEEVEKKIASAVRYEALVQRERDAENASRSMLEMLTRLGLVSMDLQVTWRSSEIFSEDAIYIFGCIPECMEEVKAGTLGEFLSAFQGHSMGSGSYVHNQLNPIELVVGDRKFSLGGYPKGLTLTEV